MVMEEERWFLQTENELSFECFEEKIDTVRKFKELMWTRGSDEVVLSSEEKCGIRVHDLCFVVSNRWLTDDLLDFIFQDMNDTTASHLF